MPFYRKMLLNFRFGPPLPNRSTAKTTWLPTQTFVSGRRRSRMKGQETDLDRGPNKIIKVLQTYCRFFKQRGAKVCFKNILEIIIRAARKEKKSRKNKSQEVAKSKQHKKGSLINIKGQLGRRRKLEAGGGAESLIPCNMPAKFQHKRTLGALSRQLRNNLIMRTPGRNGTARITG